MAKWPSLLTNLVTGAGANHFGQTETYGTLDEEGCASQADG